MQSPYSLDATPKWLNGDLPGKYIEWKQRILKKNSEEPSLNPSMAKLAFRDRIRRSEAFFNISTPRRRTLDECDASTSYGNLAEFNENGRDIERNETPVQISFILFE